MAEPVLTEFLLRLATDSEMAQRFGRSRANARKLMDEAGLAREQIDAVLSRDSNRLQYEVRKETDDILPDIYCGKIRTFEFVLETEIFEAE